MSDETKAPVRSIAQVIEIMRPVFDWATRDALKCAQLRDGLAVATDRKRADEWTRANTRARRCPCCGAELVADADGDLYKLDDWIESECGPAERDATERVEISTNVGAEICVFLRDLARALDAAYRLGGADALRIGRDQLRLDGAGFTVVVCRALPDARAFRRFLIERGEEVRT